MHYKTLILKVYNYTFTKILKSFFQRFISNKVMRKILSNNFINPSGGSYA